MFNGNIEKGAGGGGAQSQGNGYGNCELFHNTPYSNGDNWQGRLRAEPSEYS
jgi:hypothetical protein